MNFSNKFLHLYKLLTSIISCKWWFPWFHCLLWTSPQSFQLMPISFCFMDGSKHQLPLLLSWYLWLRISTSSPHQLSLFQAGEADSGQSPYMRWTSQKPAALDTEQQFSLLIYIPLLILCLFFVLLLTLNQCLHTYCISLRSPRPLSSKGAMLENYRWKPMTTGYKVDNSNRQNASLVTGQLGNFWSWESEALLKFGSCGFQPACGWFSSRWHLDASTCYGGEEKWWWQPWSLKPLQCWAWQRWEGGMEGWRRWKTSMSNITKALLGWGCFSHANLQDAAKFVTHWRDARIVFVKSNVTVKSVSEDSTSGSMGQWIREEKHLPQLWFQCMMGHFSCNSMKKAGR